MADELKSLREVGIALGGVRTEIRIYAALGLAAFAVFGGVSKFAFDKFDRLEESMAEVRGILSTMSKDTSQTRADISDIKVSVLKRLSALAHSEHARLS